MKNNILTALAFTLALATASSAMAEIPTTLRIATDGESAPYSTVKADGTAEGFEIDFAQDLCKKMELKCTVEVQDFTGMIPALNAGKFDLIMASMSITDKRAEVINFSIAYGGTGNAFATMKGSPLDNLPGTGGTLTLTSEDAPAKIKAVQDLLKGKVIGVQTSSVSSDFVNKYFKDIAEIREYQKSEEANLDLVSGRVDAVVNGRSFLFNSTKLAGFENMVLTGPVLDGGIFGGGVGFGLRKTDTDLKDKLDAAIKASAADGTLKTLSMKWFGFDITPSNLR